MDVHSKGSNVPSYGETMPAIEWDTRAEQEFMRDPNGPVLRELLPRLGEQVAARAKTLCPRDTGITAASIRVFRLDADIDGPYVLIGAGYVGVFLEHPAKQMHRPHRFLSDAVRQIAAQS